MASFQLLGFLLVVCAVFLPSTHGLSRVVGGTETTVEKRPYQASLQYFTGLSYSHSCGASIISAKFLLSAAHCNPGSLVGYYARVGSTSYRTGGQVIKVAGFLSHPNYVRNILDYDFGIVSFASGVEIALGSNVAIIPLSSGTNPADGSMVTVSGWGVTSESSSSAPVNMREVNLPKVSESVCRQTYSFLTARQICFGGTTAGGTGSCFGDSGGPAVQNGVQYGTVSGGNSCAEARVPGIYGRISSVRAWITSHTGV